MIVTIMNHEYIHFTIATITIIRNLCTINVDKKVLKNIGEEN